MAEDTPSVDKWTVRPWFWPDTQGFLAIAVFGIVAVIILVLLFRPVQLSETVQGVLTTLIGVLIGSLKDVYAFYFSSSSSSRTKDDTIRSMAAAAGEAPKDALTKWERK